jgi:hypothetical protein
LGKIAEKANCLPLSLLFFFSLSLFVCVSSKWISYNLLETVFKTGCFINHQHKSQFPKRAIWRKVCERMIE